MPKLSRRLIIAIVIAAAAVASNILTLSPSFAAEPALLTITGNVGNPNRSDYSEETDKFLATRKLISTRPGSLITPRCWTSTWFL